MEKLFVIVALVSLMTMRLLLTMALNRKKILICVMNNN